MIIAALTAHAEPEAKHVSPPGNRVWQSLLIGAVGLSLAGGYAAGAVLTGDRPSAVPLAVTGAVFSSGLLSTVITLAVASQRKDPGSLVGFILVPVISGVLSAVLAGILAGFLTRDPGTMRTVTHVVIASSLVIDTIGAVLARSLP